MIPSAAKRPMMASSYGFPPEAFDPSRLPDVNTDFLAPEDLEAFAAALAAPDTQDDDENASPTPGTPRGATSLTQPQHTPSSKLFITAHSDWAPVTPPPNSTTTQAKTPVGPTSAPDSNTNSNSNYKGLAPYQKHQKKKRKAKKARRDGFLGWRSKDETREGYLYSLLKWPLLFFVSGWLAFLGVAYLLTRAYILIYEQCVAWTGRRQRLRRAMRATNCYEDWIPAAQALDRFMGNDKWREEPEYAYYNWATIKNVLSQMRKARRRAQSAKNPADAAAAADDLRVLMEACTKSNFSGIESVRLYSQTYYGTKKLVQDFIDESEASLRYLLSANTLSGDDKRLLFKHANANFGRTALCLSGGAGFAYYHIGVVKALLEADLLPDIITGTSGGALVAALVATRTNDELKQLLIPALATKITACHEPFYLWVWRWWRTGARFDSIDWAKRSSWWSRGSMTFREAFQRTGRILNISCIPADPHSPTILCNYLTSPDCVIWSAVLASAAVPGILNPVVLMMKTKSGKLAPYSFGHKWKDGSLRTDIPIQALNLQFNVNFTIVSQVNPHVNMFFFSSRGTVGEPVTHRHGRGWRGGFLGSAAEQYIKLDLTKWLKVLRHLELLPRPLGQDWSQIWLQQFSGTITIWPRTVLSDLWHILSDPDPRRLARMMHEGQQSCFPKLSFVENRLRIERLVEQGRRLTRGGLPANTLGAAGGSASASGSSNIHDGLLEDVEDVEDVGAQMAEIARRGSLCSMLSVDDLRNLIRESNRENPIIHSSNSGGCRGRGSGGDAGFALVDDTATTEGLSTEVDTDAGEQLALDVEQARRGGGGGGCKSGRGESKHHDVEPDDQSPVGADAYEVQNRVLLEGKANSYEDNHPSDSMRRRRPALM